MASKLFLIYFYWLFVKKPTLNKNKTKLKLKQQVNGTQNSNHWDPFPSSLVSSSSSQQSLPLITFCNQNPPAANCSLFFFFFLSLKQCLPKWLRPNPNPHPAPPQKAWRTHHRPPHPRPKVPKPPNQCPSAFPPKRNPKRRRTLPK